MRALKEITEEIFKLQHLMKPVPKKSPKARKLAISINLLKVLSTFVKLAPKITETTLKWLMMDERQEKIRKNN